MSASSTTALVHESTATATSHPVASARSRSSYRPPRRQSQSTRSPLADWVIASLSRSAKWSTWLAVEPRLAGFASLEEALEGWRRRDERCHQVVAGMTALGSRRGADDDDAALAVVVLLQDGVVRVAATLRDLWEIDDVNATVWAEVKAAEPQLGSQAARYLLQRARQRLSRPAAGMVSRVGTTSLEQRMATNSDGGGREDRDLMLAVPEVEDPVADLADLLTWATGAGVVGAEEVDLIVELLAAENEGMPREAAQRLVGERRGLAMRTIRRRRDATAARLREAAPKYLAAIA